MILRHLHFFKDVGSIVAYFENYIISKGFAWA